MGRSAPIFSPVCLQGFDTWVGKQDKSGGPRGELKSLSLRLLSKSSDGYERRYTIGLEQSLNSLHNRAEGKLGGSLEALKSLPEEHLTRCKNHVDEVYQMISRCLEAETSSTRELACGAKM